MFAGGGLPFPQPNGGSTNGQGQSYSIWGLPQPIGQSGFHGGGVTQSGEGWATSPVVQPSASPARGLPPPPVLAAEATQLQLPPAAVASRVEQSIEGSSGCVVRCRGLPFSATAESVAAFFAPLEIVDNGVRMKTNAEGLPCGECFVQFATGEAAASALERNRRVPRRVAYEARVRASDSQVMGHRYVMLEQSTAAEMAKACGSGTARAVASPQAAAPVAAPAACTAAAPTRQGGSGGGKQRGGGGSEGRAGHAGSGLSDSGGSGGGHSGVASGHVVIKMRGLPYSAAEPEISSFFSGLRIAQGGVSIGRDGNGRASGEAHVEFCSEQDAQAAMTLNRQRIGSRYIELFRTKQLPSASRRSAAADSGGGSSELLRLRGMPFHSTEADVTAFFKGYSIASGGIKLGPQGGHGTVRFSTAEEARRALVNLNHSYMGNRYIELFST